MKAQQVRIGHIAKEIKMSYSLVCKILNNTPNFKPSESTRLMVLRKAQEMGFNYSSLRRIHRRKHPRVKHQSAGDIVIRTFDGEAFDSGTFVTEDLSRNGACIVKPELERGVFPVDPFYCEFKITEGPLRGNTFKGLPVRLNCEKGFLMGFKFTDMTKEQLRHLAAVC